MLISLSVNNLALIEKEEVTFGEGLNVFSGETGAGKSLVIGSVSLALGGKARADIARDPEKPAEVELVFALDREEERKKIRDLDIPVEDDGLVIIRRRFSGGRGTAKINGVTVTGSLLREISGILIDIHGQHEHQSLLYKKNHLLILDRYAGKKAEQLLDNYRKQYHCVKSIRDELKAICTDESERLREADLLRYEIGEIEDASLKDGEDELLEERFSFMNNSRKIAEAAGEASSLIGGDEAAGEMIGRAVRAFTAAADLDKDASGLMQELNDLDSLLSDIRRDLESYLSGLSFSEEEYNEVTERLNRINELKMKYGKSIPEILESLEIRQKKLEQLENADAYRAELEKKLAASEKELSGAAEELTVERRKNAAELGGRMKKALIGLNFETVQFEIAVRSAENGYTENGADDVEFMISTNPGESLKALKDVASGGELSRVMLALKTVLADTDQIDTLIFDEIDTGISGRTAQKVSESLASLSGRHQVILITHLPQIAAMADHHFLIKKTVEEGRTLTGIRELQREEIIDELGRMLSGAEMTETVRQNAEEMKELADKTKKKTS